MYVKHLQQCLADRRHYINVRKAISMLVVINSVKDELERMSFETASPTNQRATILQVRDNEGRERGMERGRCT